MLQHQCGCQALPEVQHINKRNHHNRCEKRLDRTRLLLEDLEAVRESLPTKARLRLTLTSNAHPNHAELRRTPVINLVPFRCEIGLSKAFHRREFSHGLFCLPTGAHDQIGRELR